MGHGAIILEPWQEEQNLIDQLLKNKKISKIGHSWINYSKVYGEHCYSVESDFFEESDDHGRHYNPTCRVAEGKLIKCTMPLDIDELEAAERLLKTLEKEKSSLKASASSLSYDVGKLEGKKDLLTRQLSDITKSIKAQRSELSSTNDKIAALDSKKIDKISNVVVSIVGVLDELELKGAGSVINSLYNDLGELKKLTLVGE